MGQTLGPGWLEAVVSAEHLDGERWGVNLETMGQTLSQGGWKLWLVLSTWYLIDGERWGVNLETMGQTLSQCGWKLWPSADTWYLIDGERWGVNLETIHQDPGAREWPGGCGSPGT
ncbi:hypothetical protein RRG08_006709 [Elysia crispata]|uniref:Uncharacterized protein n=1 Tax=Elysia crispata TaxID=231223 RepID=A0AAE1DAC8_9GAST|nr:hypothetical protein RRG08_006709 [Elysia crispata]